MDNQETEQAGHVGEASERPSATLSPGSGFVEVAAEESEEFEVIRSGDLQQPGDGSGEQDTDEEFGDSLESTLLAELDNTEGASQPTQQQRIALEGGDSENEDGFVDVVIDESKHSETADQPTEQKASLFEEEGWDEVEFEDVLHEEIDKALALHNQVAEQAGGQAQRKQGPRVTFDL